MLYKIFKENVDRKDVLVVKTYSKRQEVKHEKKNLKNRKKLEYFFFRRTEFVYPLQRSEMSFLIE